MPAIITREVDQLGHVTSAPAPSSDERMSSAPSSDEPPRAPSATAVGEPVSPPSVIDKTYAATVAHQRYADMLLRVLGLLLLLHVLNLLLLLASCRTTPCALREGV